MDPQRAALVEKAIARRALLAADTNALRLVNGQGDGLPGITLDRFDRHFLIQTYSARPALSPSLLAEYVRSRFPAAYIISKNRTLPAAECIARAEVWLEEAGPQTEITEHGLHFRVDLRDAVNPGLFLDMRANRLRVAKRAKGRRILNAFAYTCAFGVHACSRGASQVVNVDISRKVLAWGEQNYRLNQLPVKDGEFVAADCGLYLRGAAKRSNCFDLVILDPPSFARHQGRVFTVKTGLPRLIKAGLEVLNQNGTLFVSTNHSEVDDKLLGRWLRNAGLAAGRHLRRMQTWGQDSDFPGTGAMKESHLAAAMADWD
ncbi:MAG: class I SAM-dependent rRNA methyltransferase [candidate division FCPU426 bacterium]